MKRAKSVRAKRPKLSDEEKRRRAHRRLVTRIFEGAGFAAASGVNDIHFDFKKAKTEFDDCFVWKNVVVFVEHTTVKDVSSHYKGKAYNYQEFIDHRDDFLDFALDRFPELRKKVQDFDKAHLEVRFAYCTTSELSDESIERMKHVSVLDQENAAYFNSLVKAIRASARNEVLDFLDVPYERAGDAVTSASHNIHSFPAHLVPSSATYLPTGHVVVSFYARPADLLEMGYVLRRQGWRMNEFLFQRMVDKSKIDSIRNHLISSKRVFLNNVVVALPYDVVLHQADGSVLGSSIPKMEVGSIAIRRKFNSIGIIDGQHRVFSYHEGGKEDQNIKTLRERQDLLVTGVVFPAGMTEADRIKVQADIFLEINSKQTSAASDLIQDLSVLTSPYSEISVARQVLRRLNQNGVLAGKFARHSADRGRLKTSSVVSYGLKPIVKFSGSDALFEVWTNVFKGEIAAAKAGAPVDEYVKWAALQISTVFSAIREATGVSWEVSSKTAPGVLSTTFVNGVLVLMRQLLENKKTLDRATLVADFAVLSDFPFGSYKSSQYGAMGRDMYKKLFGARVQQAAALAE